MSRKKFLRKLGYLLVLPFLWLVNKLIDTQINIAAKEKIYLPEEISQSLSIHRGLIINKKEGAIKIYSGKCTHLGCQLTKIENGIITCPCHGSKFDEFGKPLKGPASENLSELKINIEENSNRLFVYE